MEEVVVLVRAGVAVVVGAAALTTGTAYADQLRNSPAAAPSRPGAAVAGERPTADPGEHVAVSVRVPAFALMRVVDGQLTAAWTNSGRAPRGSDSISVVRDGGPVVPVTARERGVLVGCAAAARLVWQPGQWVSLDGKGCAVG